MAEARIHTSEASCRCVQCIQNRTYERFYNSAQSETWISSDNVDSRCEMPSQTLGSIVNVEQNRPPSDSSDSTSTTESLNNAQHGIIAISPVDSSQTSLTMSNVQSDVAQDSTRYTSETASISETSSSANQADEFPNYSQIMSDFNNYSGRFGLIHYREVNSEVDDDSDSSSEDSTSDDESSDPNIQLCPLNDTDGCEDDCPYLHGELCYVCRTHNLNPFEPEKHLDACVAQHETQSQDMECSICMEKVWESEIDYNFAIQENCFHCFCSTCLDSWRQNVAMANNEACPVCRTPSGHAIASKYWLTCPLSKKKVIEWMKENEQEIDY
ncbi:suppressor protein SRP40 [Biomphalaria glabrata]|nr:suppressor protein SRP40-like; partial [Biomphalaria glabrata]